MSLLKWEAHRPVLRSVRCKACLTYRYYAQSARVKKGGLWIIEECRIRWCIMSSQELMLLSDGGGAQVDKRTMKGIAWWPAMWNGMRIWLWWRRRQRAGRRRHIQNERWDYSLGDPSTYISASECESWAAAWQWMQCVCLWRSIYPSSVTSWWVVVENASREKGEKQKVAAAAAVRIRANKMKENDGAKR